MAVASTASVDDSGDRNEVAARLSPSAPDHIGRRLREVRQARGMSLREVARRIQVSPSFVSQVERGKANPSVGTLYALVTELGASLDELMGDGVDVASEVGVAETVADRPALAVGDDSPEGRTAMSWDPIGADWPRVGVPVQRRRGRRRVQLSGVVWERLTHDDDPHVDFLHVTYAPGSASCSEEDMMRHGGREYGHIISGRLDVQVGFEVYQLEAGDSTHFDSTTPHRLCNPYDEPCTAIWVVLGRRADDRVRQVLNAESSHLPGLL